MILDFDAGRSVVVNGPKHRPKGYKLKPRIRVITEAFSGSISGKVLNSERMPVAYALLDSDTITTSIIDKTSGFFKLAFLPQNSYTVIVEDTSGRSFSQDSVAVQNGQDFGLGDIILD